MPPVKRTRSRGPDDYIANNLTVRAWDSVRSVQASARKVGLNPSMSEVVIALAKVAESDPAPVFEVLTEGA